VAKRSNFSCSIKDPSGSILSDENEILSRWREYFKDLLNSVKAINDDTLEPICFGEEEVFTAREIATVIGQLKSRKATGEDENRPEMLKALNSEGILWLTRVCQLAGSLAKYQKNVRQA